MEDVIIADRFTKALLLAIAFFLAVLCVENLFLPARIVRGASTDLQFSADKDRFYFFDPAAQKVYSYPANGGHPQSAVQLQKPGGELRPVSSF